MPARFWTFARIGLALWLTLSLIPRSRTVGATAAATTISLSGAMVSGDVGRFAISPSGLWVVFTSDEQTPGVSQLYRVGIDGGAPVRLNTVLTSTRDLTDLKITADGHWLLYSVEFWDDGYATNDQKAIYRLPLDNSTESVRLTPDLSPNGYIMYYGFGVSSDSQYIVYRVCYETGGLGCDIFSAPINGPAPAVKLNRDLPPGGMIWGYGLSRDGQRVIYWGRESSAVNELYSVPVQGPASASVKLNGPLVVGGQVDWPVIFSADGQRVFFRADSEMVGAYNLFSAPVDGSAPAVQLSPPAAPGYRSHIGVDFAGGNSPGYRAYTANVDPAVGWAVYRVPAIGPSTANVKLSGLLSPGYRVASTAFTSSSRLVYSSINSSASTMQYYSVPLSGPASASVLLTPDLASYGSSSLMTQDGQRLLYSIASGTYAVPMNGPASAAEKISPAWGTLTLSPDGERAVIRALFDTNNLYSIRILGPVTNTVQVSGPIAGDSVPYQSSFAFTPDSTRIVYMAPNANGHIELFATTEGYFTSYHVYLPLSAR